jgi:hypothetical protein
LAEGFNLVIPGFVPLALVPPSRRCSRRLDVPSGLETAAMITIVIVA